MNPSLPLEYMGRIFIKKIVKKSKKSIFSSFLNIPQMCPIPAVYLAIKNATLGTYFGTPKKVKNAKKTPKF